MPNSFGAGGVEATGLRCSSCGCPTPEAAIARVRQRVTEGGHDVPDTVVRRRFHAGWRNWGNIYKDLVDEWAEYDTSGDTPVILAEQSSSELL